MEITLNDLIARIEESDALEVDAIITALSRRYSLLYPDWEITFLSLPKEDPVARMRILESILEIECRRTDCHTGVRAGSQ